MIWSSNTTASGNATPRLLDNGNLVVIDQNDEDIWQSFDYPTDTLLPGMKLGRDYVRRKEWSFSSWKSSEDPAPGKLTLSVDTLGYPENKLRQFYHIKDNASGWKPVLTQPSDPRDTYNMCGAYGTCTIDKYQQSCNCMDEKRFVPENQKGWDTGDRSGGCIRRTPLECKSGLEGLSSTMVAKVVRRSLVGRPGS
ncbi:putative non-specific serine/threonine protein kinase [Helianthus anomalus]